MFCRLCDKQVKLQNSHIIPAFAFRWLRETGGYIRKIDNPNLRVQDGIKLKLLCVECENRIGFSEKKFVEQIFKQFTNEKIETLYHDDWYCKFCCSVSWRVAMYFIETEKYKGLEKDKQIALLEAATTWKKYLNGEISNPQKYEQHVLMFQKIGLEFGRDAPKKILTVIC